ncbi:hypothetical protein llap_10185 [Limosa lapponica baueri]|uniref:Uncharacterized protein n=1 Tax=Limosa lapponica baueri TaxID=1758121 RepID=A0A2I0U0P8_LIMLA|nr:hypothetical protein llap_10185 [Limosa lapponica baueri]
MTVGSRPPQRKRSPDSAQKGQGRDGQKWPKISRQVVARSHTESPHLTHSSFTPSKSLQNSCIIMMPQSVALDGVTHCYAMTSYEASDIVGAITENRRELIRSS